MLRLDLRRANLDGLIAREEDRSSSIFCIALEHIPTLLQFANSHSCLLKPKQVGWGTTMRATWRIAVCGLAAITSLVNLQLRAQQARETVIEAPSLDRPLIFDSSTRGSGGTKIAGPKFRVVPLTGL